MESSSYFGFGRKPGFKGNSIYYTIDEEFTGSNATTVPINQIYKESIMVLKHPNIGNITGKGDYLKGNVSGDSNKSIPTLEINSKNRIGHKPIIRDEITESNDKNVTKHLLSMYATPTLNNIHGILDDDNGMDNSMYPQQTNNITTVEDIDSEIMPYKQMQMASVESTYIDMPNLYNCINSSNGRKQYYDILQPKIEKYVIEAAKTENEHAERKIANGKKFYKKIQNSQQFVSDFDYTSSNTVADTCTTCNFDVTAPNSEYIFNIKDFDNTNQEFLKFNESNKKEEKDEIPAKKEKFPDSYIYKTDTATAKSTSGTMIASDKQYIESHYNVDDLCQWNVY